MSPALARSHGADEEDDVLTRWKLLGVVAAQAQVLAGCVIGEGKPTGGRGAPGEGAVIGGTESVPGARPYQVLMTATPDDRVICGGMLIDDDSVLTAAHCCQQVTVQTLIVTLGEHDRSIAEGTEQKRRATRIAVHPQYDGPTAANDVCVIQLDSPVQLDDRVATVALAGPGEDAPGQTAVTSGWGWTDVNTKQYAPRLQETELPIVDSATCNQSGRLDRKVTEDMLCAGAATSDRGGCFKDSGGPLVVQTSFGPRAVGVLIWGRGDCNSYTVFARITALASWIQRAAVPDAPVPDGSDAGVPGPVPAPGAPDAGVAR
jgi:trypsin